MALSSFLFNTLREPGPYAQLSDILVNALNKTGAIYEMRMSGERFLATPRLGDTLGILVLGELHTLTFVPKTDAKLSKKPKLDDITANVIARIDADGVPRLFKQCLDAALCDLAGRVAHSHEHADFRLGFHSGCLVCGVPHPSHGLTGPFQLTNANYKALCLVCASHKFANTVGTAVAKCDECVNGGMAWAQAPQRGQCKTHEYVSSVVSFSMDKPTFLLIDVIRVTLKGGQIVQIGLIEVTRGYSFEHQVFAVACTDAECADKNKGVHTHVGMRLGFDYLCACAISVDGHRPKNRDDIKKLKLGKPSFGFLDADDARDGLCNRAFFCGACKPEKSVDVVNKLCILDDAAARLAHGVPKNGRPRPRAVNKGLCAACSTRIGKQSDESGRCNAPGCGAASTMAPPPHVSNDALFVLNRMRYVLRPEFCGTHAPVGSMAAGRHACSVMVTAQLQCTEAKLRGGDFCATHVKADQLTKRGLKEQLFVFVFEHMLDSWLSLPDCKWFEVAERTRDQRMVDTADDLDEACRDYRPDLAIFLQCKLDKSIQLTIGAECDEFGHRFYSRNCITEEERVATIAVQSRNKFGDSDMRFLSVRAVPEGVDAGNRTVFGDKTHKALELVRPLEFIQIVQTAFDSMVAWTEHARDKPGLTSVRFGAKRADGTSRAHAADEQAMWHTSQTRDTDLNN